MFHEANFKFRINHSHCSLFVPNDGSSKSMFILFVLKILNSNDPSGIKYVTLDNYRNPLKSTY